MRQKYADLHRRIPIFGPDGPPAVERRVLSRSPSSSVAQRSTGRSPRSAHASQTAELISAMGEATTLVGCRRVLRRSGTCRRASSGARSGRDHQPHKESSVNHKSASASTPRPTSSGRPSPTSNVGPSGPTRSELSSSSTEPLLSATACASDSRRSPPRVDHQVRSNPASRSAGGRAGRGRTHRSPGRDRQRRQHQDRRPCPHPDGSRRHPRRPRQPPDHQTLRPPRAAPGVGRVEPAIDVPIVLSNRGRRYRPR